MKRAPKKPAIPRTAEETVRHALIELLSGQSISAREISTEMHMAEKDIYGHLEHIRRTLHATGAVLDVTPAECRSCGFVFAKRERLTTPGKCPVCRSETILEPLYSIRRLQRHDAG